MPETSYATELSDPPTMPPELPVNRVTPEAPPHPVESPPSENPVPVREPPEVKPPVAAVWPARDGRAPVSSWVF